MDLKTCQYWSSAELQRVRDDLAGLRLMRLNRAAATVHWWMWGRSGTDARGLRRENGRAR